MTFDKKQIYKDKLKKFFAYIVFGILVVMPTLLFLILGIKQTALERKCAQNEQIDVAFHIMSIANKMRVDDMLMNGHASRIEDYFPAAREWVKSEKKGLERLLSSYYQD